MCKNKSFTRNAGSAQRNRASSQTGTSLVRSWARQTLISSFIAKQIESAHTRIKRFREIPLSLVHTLTFILWFNHTAQSIKIVSILQASINTNAVQPIKPHNTFRLRTSDISFFNRSPQVIKLRTTKSSIVFTVSRQTQTFHFQFTQSVRKLVLIRCRRRLTEHFTHNFTEQSWRSQ